MQRSPVPRFGNWESEENVPYAAYFDNARKSGSGGKTNPNDHQENPDMFLTSVSPIRVPSVRKDVEFKGQKEPEAARPKHEHPVSREDSESRRLPDSSLHPGVSHQRHGGVRSGGGKSESGSPRVPDALRPMHEHPPSRGDGDLKRPTDSPSHRDPVGGRPTYSPLHHDLVGRGPTDSPSHQDPVGRRANVDSPNHRHGGMSAGDTTPKRVTPQSVGSDRSIEQLPLHSHYLARVGGKSNGVSSPLSERKGPSEGSHTPESRFKSVTNRGDETLDHSLAVPKFGDWDESDPASAEGYTHIFDRVREEKQSGAEKVPVVQTVTSYSNGQKNNGKGNSQKRGWFDCWSWCR